MFRHVSARWGIGYIVRGANVGDVNMYVRVPGFGEDACDHCVLLRVPRAAGIPGLYDSLVIASACDCGVAYARKDDTVYS